MDFLMNLVNSTRAEKGLAALAQEDYDALVSSLNVSFDNPVSQVNDYNRNRVIEAGLTYEAGSLLGGATTPGEIAPVPTAAENIASAGQEQAQVNTAAQNLAAAQAENARLIAEARAQQQLLGIDDEELARQSERRGGSPSTLLAGTKTTGLLGG